MVSLVLIPFCALQGADVVFSAGNKVASAKNGVRVSAHF